VKSRLPVICVVLLLTIMAGLMLGPMWQETATVDETTFMGGGYAYLKTGSAKMAEENPILIQMIIGAPMLAFDVHISEEARAIMEQRAFSPVGWPWSGPPRRLEELFPQGVNWYHFGLAEAQHFGRILVYDAKNDAERLLFWSRFTQLVLTLATGALVFFWTRRLTNKAWAGVMATALWVFNPAALAYGHLAITEPGIAFAYPLAVWWFTRTVERPAAANVVVLGTLCAVAMQMKFLALLLAPTLVALLVIKWSRDRVIAPPRALLKWVALLAVVAWVTTLVIHFPHWNPPPPISTAQADALNVPGWFRAVRPLLIPGEFFKAVTLKLLHSQAGQDAYLMGEWRKMGWWYYYPLAMWFKTPVPLLMLTGVGAGLLVKRWREAPFAAVVPWVAAVLFLLFALPSKINIGVRHMLPVYPLLAVGVAVEIFRCGRKVQVAGWALCAWLFGVAVFASPHFIPYTNEFGGGAGNGYKVLIDSNYDWGQDGKRLKKWMEDNRVDHIYLDFFGTQPAIEWHGISNTRVNAETARRIQQGWLVVSVSNLMRPEWAWLREQHQPDARIGYTLFAYRLP
jgi:hypothetical protein